MKVIPYATATGTRRNQQAMLRAGWRVLMTPDHRTRAKMMALPWSGYALDNGAFSAFNQCTEFDDSAFEDMVDRWGQGADWLVVPDVVGDRPGTLASVARWLPRLRGVCPLMIAVQDGMTASDVDRWGDVGIFLGGSTDWKLRTMRYWGEAARERGAWFHVARVNSAKRIRLCQDAGAHSFDGTSASRYSKTLRMLDQARRQAHLADIWGRE